MAENMGHRTRINREYNNSSQDKWLSCGGDYVEKKRNGITSECELFLVELKLVNLKHMCCRHQ